jgi:hypothetical protein
MTTTLKTTGTQLSWPNLWICGTVEGTEVLTQGTENLFNEIKAENSTNIGKEIDIQVYKAFRIPNSHNQKRISLHHN